MAFNTLTKASRLVSRLVRIAIRNPAGLRHVLGTAFAESENHLEHASDPSRLAGVHLETLLEELPGGANVQVFFRPKVQFSINLYEALALGALVRVSGAKRAFEFGTYRGISSSQIALNLGPEGKLFTLDLPPTDPALKFQLTQPDEIKIAKETIKGDVIPKELLPRIEFLHADSAVFDESPYADSMDFVFVDGAHTFDYVQNDTLKGWRMLKPGGFIAWHDCRSQTPDVVRFLLNSPYAATRIVGTTMAYARKS